MSSSLPITIGGSITPFPGVPYGGCGENSISPPYTEANLPLFSNPISSYQVCICGGGNSALVSACYIASKGFKVNVFTRKPTEWKTTLSVTTEGSSWESRGTFTGKLNQISSNPDEVIPGSTYVIIAAPAHVHPVLLQQIAPYLDEGCRVGTVFAQGGFDWAAKYAFAAAGASSSDEANPQIKSSNNINTVSYTKKIACIFGLQNIPWICRATKYGTEGKIVGPKKKLYVATYPVEMKQTVANELAFLYDIPTTTIANFLSLTLTPSNQIIHPARYYSIFHDWDGMKTYTMEDMKIKKATTLYKDFDELSSEILSQLDNELQQIKFSILQRVPQLDLSSILPIGERIVKQYGEDVKDTSSLQQIFATNLGYAGVNTPLQKVNEDSFIPATQSRLFWEDIPYGLCILKNIAELCGNFPTPAIDRMILWHQQYMGKNFLNEATGQLNPLLIPETGAPMKYNIHSIEELVSTCLPESLLSYQSPQPIYSAMNNHRSKL